jgi:dTDP-4-dehydrorhamnose 3,5-epimerase
MIKVVKTNILDLIIIEPSIHKDIRGWFLESYSKNDMTENGILIDFIQDNHSKTLVKGTIRGLHLQIYPKAQSKLIRCTKGAILDVAVDLRQNSETYLKWYSIELSEYNNKQLFIPKGFAHGFLTLEDNTEVQYKVDEVYSKNHELSIIYNDPTINIRWPVENPLLSDKDSKASNLNELIDKIK